MAPSDYLDTLQTLCRPHRVSIMRRGEFIGTRMEQPLLLKLRAAVAGSIGAGSAGTSSYGTPLNVGARDLQDRIMDQARQAAALHRIDFGGARPVLDIVVWNLGVGILNAYRADRMPDSALQAAHRQAQGWEASISDLLDPPFRFALSRPCPLCGASWVDVWANGSSERMQALQVTERPEDLEASTVECMDCRAVWRGVLEARALRADLDDRDEVGLVTLAPDLKAVG